MARSQKFFLPPRMTSAQRTAIVDPESGLTVYDTTLRTFYRYNSDTSAWESYYIAADDSLTASRIAGIGASKEITSLDTATYPSLDELAYLKGVTSSVQTQLGKKGYTLYATGDSITPADSTTYFVGSGYPYAMGIASFARPLYIPQTGTITKVYGVSRQTVGTGETSSIYVRYDDTTDTLITSSMVNNVATSPFSKNDLSISVTEGHFIEIKWVTPAWVTNPVNCVLSVIIYIVPS